MVVKSKSSTTIKKKVFIDESESEASMGASSPDLDDESDSFDDSSEGGTIHSDEEDITDSKKSDNVEKAKSPPSAKKTANQISPTPTKNGSNKL